MNKIFNKVRKNRALALLLVFAMMLSILPLNTVVAAPITQANITVTPTASSGVTDTTENHSDNNVLFAGTYQALGDSNYPQMKLYVDGLDLTKYTDVTFDFKPSREGMSLHVRPYGKTAEGADAKIKYGTYGSSSHIAVTGGTGRQKFTDDLTAATGDGDGPALATLEYFDVIFDGKKTASGDLEFVLYSVTFSGDEVEPVVFGNDQLIEDEPDTNPDEGGTTPNPDEGNGNAPVAQPTLTPRYMDSCYSNVTNKHDGAVLAVSYTTAIQWSQIFVEVEGHDFSAHDVALVEIEPSRPGMNFCIKDQSGVIYNWSTLDETDIVEVPLNQNVTTLIFCFDSQAGGYEAGKEITAIVKGVEFVNSKESSTEEVPVELKVEGNEFVIDEQGRLYSANGTTQLRGMIVFPDTFRVEVGKVLTINYETNISSIDGWFAYNNGGTDKINKKITSDKNSLEIVIDQAFVEFFAGNPGTEGYSTRLRLKAAQDSCPAGSYFALTSVTYGEPTSEPEEVVIPAWQAQGGPTLTLNTDSSVFNCKVNADKSVNVKFNAPAGWTPLPVAVENCDVTKYSQLVVDLTTADGLYFYVYDAKGSVGDKYEYDGVERTKIRIDLKEDSDKFDLWINPQQGNGSKEFIIHSVTLVDPTIPEGELVDTALQVESGTFTMKGTDTVEATSGTKMRCMFELPVDFRVEEGKQLVIGYETNLTGVELEAAYGTDTKKQLIEEIETAEKSIVLDIDSFLAGFINNNGGSAPRLRLKHGGITADGFFTLKYVVYRDVPAQQYDPAQVPQGIAVTYYDDIYSRGIAWNTDNTVPTSALYYVEKTGEMTADTVNWEGDDVEVVEVTNPKAFEDYQGKVWHTFKATIEDLTPEAKYFFRVGSEEYGWSGVGSFTIEKASKDIDSLHFIHLTDTQEEQLASFKKYAKVVKSAYELMPNAAFMAHTGDQVNNGEKLSYNEDPSKSQNDIRMQEWMDVLDAPKANLMNSVLMPTVGNHDCGQFVFTDRFNISWADYQKDKEETTDVNEDLDDMKTGGCYVYTYGEAENGVLIISLNTNQLWTSAFDTYQRVWLENTLETYKDYKWKIVQMHAGAITGGGHTNDGESKYLRSTIMPLFSKYEVDLVLQGHDHVYTRSRSMAYGVNPFETTDAEKPVYFDGHTPVYLSAVEKTLEVNGVERKVWIEPQGTHYITINASGGKRYTELDPSQLDPIIVEAEGENPLNPTDEDGKYGSMTGLDKPTFALVSIEGDILVYDVYTYDAETNKSTMYDTFAVDKSSIRGYDPSNPHEGKEEVQLYGLKVNLENNTKKYDGIPVKLDIYGFNCSNPEIMDCEQFKYSIEVVSGGLDPITGNRYKFNPGNLIYGHLPKEPGEYILKIELPQSNKYYWGETEIRFTITN